MNSSPSGTATFLFTDIEGSTQLWENHPAAMRDARAVRLLGAADAIRRRIDSGPTPLELAEYEKEVRALQERMSEAGFHRAWQEAQSLSIDDAIAPARQAP